MAAIISELKKHFPAFPDEMLLSKGGPTLNESLNKRDALLQSHFPTVMVPRHEDLAPCEVGRTRLLMGRDGLYLETRPQWGHLVERLWDSPRPLPYGEVVEVDTFASAIASARKDIISSGYCAATWAQDDKEWAGWIVYDSGTDEFSMLALPAEERSAAHICSRLPDLAPHEHLAIDLHSHGKGDAFFSAQDDADDRGGVRICIVMGGFNDGHFDKVRLRYVVEGFFINRKWVML